MHQINCCGVSPVVAEVGAGDSAEPEQSVRIAGPHEGTFGNVGEAVHSIVQARLFTRATRQLSEAAQAQPAGTLDGRARVHRIATRAHRRSIDRSHVRHGARYAAETSQTGVRTLSAPMSTFRRYLIIQAMVFVCGIVGPIFLIIFFASPSDPQMKWAFWAGWFITYADIMIALAITAGTRENTKVQVPQKVR